MTSSRLCLTGFPQTRSVWETWLCEPVDLLELRLDGVSQVDATTFDWIRSHAERLIVTCRPVRELGRFQGPEADRLAILRLAREAGPAWIDIEVSVFESGQAGLVIPALGGRAYEDYRTRWSQGEGEAGLDPILGRARDRTRVLISLHDAGADIRDAIARVTRFPADGVKVVVGIRRPEDLAALLDAAQERPLARYPVRVISGLGPLGVSLRARPSLTGSSWTYVARSESERTVSDQFTLHDVARWRTRESPALRPIFLAGGPGVLDSPGPAVYNRLFAARALGFQYLPLPAARWEDAIRLAARARASGLSVTTPFKRDAFSASPRVDEWANAARSCNTLRLRGDRVATGFSTDAEAAFRAFPERIEGQTVLILGAGGAALAVAAAARRARANPIFAARDPDAARREIGPGAGRVLPWQRRHEVDADILVNATPVGRDGSASPWEGPFRARMVLDLAMRRGRETALVREARKAGVRRVVSGLDFWCVQGALQMRRLTGRPFEPRELFDALWRLGWYGPTERRVIALIGMRGAGKTTIGDLAAARLGWPFLDTDRLVEQRLGARVTDLFLQGREEEFRAAESEQVREALSRGPAVVATGGGCVEDPSVREALKSVYTVWLTAPNEVLAQRTLQSGRPALTRWSWRTEFEVVSARREAFYAECACRTVCTDGLDPQEVLDEIIHPGRLFSADHVW